MSKVMYSDVILTRVQWHCKQRLHYWLQWLMVTADDRTQCTWESSEQSDTFKNDKRQPDEKKCSNSRKLNWNTTSWQTVKVLVGCVQMPLPLSPLWATINAILEKACTVRVECMQNYYTIYWKVIVYIHAVQTLELLCIHTYSMANLRILYNCTTCSTGICRELYKWLIMVGLVI